MVIQNLPFLHKTKVPTLLLFRDVVDVKSGGNVEYSAHIVVGAESALIFDNAKMFGTAMSCSTRIVRRIRIYCLLLTGSEFPSFGLLDGLHYDCVFELISIIAGILPKFAREWEIISRYYDIRDLSTSCNPDAFSFKR